MKKVLMAVLVFLITALITNAQFEKGSLIIGASSSVNLVNSGSGLMSIGFSNITETEEYDGFENTFESKERQYNLMPRAGYFFIDNLAAGMGVNFGRSVTVTNDDGEYTTTLTLFALEPFIRYYLPTNKVMPFFELKGGLGSVKDKYQYENDDPDEYKHKLSTMGAGVGASFPVGMNASFDLMAGYYIINRKYEEEVFRETYKSGTIGLEFGFRVFFGGYGSGADSSY